MKWKQKEVRAMSRETSGFRRTLTNIWEMREAAENEERRESGEQNCRNLCNSKASVPVRSPAKLPAAFSSVWDLKGIAVELKGSQCWAASLPPEFICSVWSFSPSMSSRSANRISPTYKTPIVLWTNPAML